MANSQNISLNTATIEEMKGANNMYINEEVVSALKSAGIPSNIIAALMQVKGLRQIVKHDNVSRLMEVKGIGEKRSTTIISVIKAAREAAKANVEVRESWKAPEREKATGFSVRMYDASELFRDHLNEINELANYTPNKDDDPSVLPDMRKKMQKLMQALLVPEAFTVRESEARSIRLTEADIPNILGVDYDAKRPTTKIMAIEHGIQKLFCFNWQLLGFDSVVGQESLDEFQQNLMFKIGRYGIKVENNLGSYTLYGGVGASAGHQKKEVLVMAEAKALKANESFFWFGRTMEDFIKNVPLTGAEFWKMRANLLRPHLKAFETENGETIKIKDILVVKDVKKLYHIENARIVGVDEKDKSKLVTDTTADEPVILGDGAMLFIYKMKAQGQACGTGLKGFGCDASSSIEALCEKHGVAVEDFLNMKIEGIDGKMHRVGDYKVICGEGCWKFDKAFSGYGEYLAWIEDMAKAYPGIDNLCILRQAEEIEDDEKVRRLTRTLIQQWMFMSGKEIRQLTAKARSGLRKSKTASGAIRKLAALFKTEEERTEVEKLFSEAPWLVASPAIQDYLKGSWERKKVEAASGKFRTEGQYPYIMQDPVALLEVWVLGMNPDNPDLGLLKGDEVSCADVQEDRKLLCVRFPANFLTAMVMKNCAFKNAFRTLNGVMVISVHSLILIAQDGDVDGDEMAVIYDRLAISLTERMRNTFNPPVVLFKHGSKAKRSTHETKEAFVRDAYDALWRAKKYDSVGLYANLATKLAYLAAVAHKNATAATDPAKAEKLFNLLNKYLEDMSKASTGAIMAIDQVKGNQVDKTLIDDLNTIGRKTNGTFVELAKHLGKNPEAAKKMRHPFVHFFNALNKGCPVPETEVLPANKDNFVDEIASLILRDAGDWSDFDYQGLKWNKIAANEALTNHSAPLMNVKNGFVTKEMVQTIKDNWFKSRAKNRSEEIADKTIETMAKMKVGNQIGLKELMLLLWRNEAAAAYRMEGVTLTEKKAEYTTVCRDILNMFLASSEWVNKYNKARPEGYVFTMAEKQAILANYIIRDALELANRGNGLDSKKGSYAMFCLKLFAKEIRENIAANPVDKDRFGTDTSALMADALLEMELDDLEDDLELFEVVPSVQETVEDIPALPEMTDEELQRLAEESMEE